MIRFLKDRMSSISSDLYEEILKPNKCHTNRIIQIVPCKTALSMALEKYPKITKSSWMDNKAATTNGLILRLPGFSTSTTSRLLE